VNKYILIYKNMCILCRKNYSSRL